MIGTLAEGVEAALADLRPSFAADDFQIALESLGESGAVVIAIHAGPGACLDCLMPDPMLGQVVEAAIRRHAPGVISVDTIKRFEAP
ncbi:MAG: NifU family protein [Pseudomonadota bacterium]